MVDFILISMKYFAVVTLLLASATFAFGVSIEEIARLSQLNTSDDLIIEIIQKSGMDRPATSKDVILLKEKGVSERVIQHVLKASRTAQKESQRAELQTLPENMRAFYTTDKDGKRIRVVTNLDEKGRRMGGPVPKAPKYEPPPPTRSDRDDYDASREIRVIVEQRPEERPMEEEYPFDDRYGRPIPMDLFEYGYGGFYPYYPGTPFFSPFVFPHSKGKCHRCKNQLFPGTPGQTLWRTDAGYGRRSVVRAPRTHRPNKPHSHSRGMRPGPR
jgi:hypothetical protein